MKHSLTFKFLAILLCTLTLLGAVLCAAGFFLLGNMGALAGQSAEDIRTRTLRNRSRGFGEAYASVWASGAYGQMPQEMVEARIRETCDAYFPDTDLSITLRNAEGEAVSSFRRGKTEGTGFEFQIYYVTYHRFCGYLSDFIDEAPPEGSFFFPVEGFLPCYARSETAIGGLSFTVTLGQIRGTGQNFWQMLELLALRKTQLAVLLGISLLLFAVFAVYLCADAGHGPGTDEIRPAGLNALPMDLYAGGLIFFWLLLLSVLSNGMKWISEQSWQGILLCLGSVGFLGSLAFVGFCFAFAAQAKMKNGFFWRNTLCGRCIGLALRIAVKLLCAAGRLLPALWRLMLRLVTDAWKVTLALVMILWNLLKRGYLGLQHLLGRMFRATERFLSRLPVMWQWLLIGFVLMAVLCNAVFSRSAGSMLFAVLLFGAAVVYGAGSFGALMDGAKQMRGGNLEAKVDDRYLIGAFREFAGELNGLADVAMDSAQKQLKSDRMKTELITNVSHDIKTPLTSIINYVDLLEKPHTPEQEATYLEVLSRQSQRMRKLIDDLIEMSKASTGNIPVEIASIDAAEAVNQALGEFADKLSAAGLTPVFRQPGESIFLLADGRLLWRAMSNVLSNAVKYSMPGTRLYVDLSAVEEKVVISFRNISGAELNVTAEELMERFVRGDSSRNTEGSGLGLNIARSLMELQKGELQLLVDGDLFKVTLVFPGEKHSPTV